MAIFSKAVNIRVSPLMESVRPSLLPAVGSWMRVAYCTVSVSRPLASYLFSVTAPCPSIT
ncbi:hypothetical protein D3C76_1144590 [compost metagenome]